jgi:GNAT superfamily N-acetyltransferase
MDDHNPPQLRPARPGDLPQLTALHTASRMSAYEPFLEPEAMARVGQEVRNRWAVWFAEETTRHRLLLVAEVSSELRGFGLTEQGEDGAMLRALHVAPALRGRGIGTLLHDALVDWCASWGCRQLHLHVIVGNHRARGFYNRHGWVDTQRRKRRRLGGQDLEIACYKHSPR